MASSNVHAFPGGLAPPPAGMNDTFFRALSDACPVGIFHTDAQGQCVYTNARWQAIYGLTLQQSLGEGWSQSIHPDDRERIVAAWLAAAGKAEGFEERFRLLTPQGRTLHVHARARAIAEGDTVTGYVGTIEDVTDQLQRERELQGSNDFLGRAEQVAGVGGWRLDLRTRMLAWTRQTRRIYELPENFVPAWDEHLRYFDPAEQALIVETANRCIRTGTPWDLELPMRTATGRQIWIRSVGQVEYGADGSAATLVGALQDITTKKRLEQELQSSSERLQRALEGSRLALWDFNLATGTVYLSETWALMMGHAPVATECAPADLVALVPAEDVAAIRCAIVDVLQGRNASYSVEHRVRRGDGSVMWVLSTGKVAERNAGGRVVRMVGTNRDVSDARRIQDELRAANDAKSAFLANMSHEIRTPLNGIMGLTALMLEEPLPDVQLRRAELIDQSSRSLLALVNDILDLSKIEAGHLAIEAVAFDLHEFLHDLVSLFRFRASQKGLDFNFVLDPAVPRRIEADPLRLRQVLTNLLGNAVKFTDAGWNGLFVSRAEGAHGPRLNFAVADTGPGIDDETRARLFQRFVQADDSTSRRYGGTGLGLAIVRQLADLMHGTIELRSAPGEGANFTFSMPLVEASGADDERAAVRPDGIAQGPLKVLLVEDNATNQVVTLGMLARLGHTEVAVADDGARAVAMAEGGGFDIVLMDCHMPVMDGYEATRRLRYQGVRTPIIALTASAMAADRAKCMAAGMDDHLAKPLSIAALHQVLARWRPDGAAADTPPAFDEAGFRSRFGRHEALATMALRTFLEVTPKVLDRLDAALADGDRERVKLESHTCKGSGLMVGASRFGALAAAIEDASAEADFTRLAVDTATLKSAFDEFAVRIAPMPADKAP